MSYRTTVNEVQIFGNNECYQKWLDFIKSQGIEVDDEGCYEGEIKDFMGALLVIEDIVMDIYKEREEMKKYRKDTKGIFDWSDIPEKIEKWKNDDLGVSLFDEILEAVNNGYAFIPYQFYKACENVLVRDNTFSVKSHLHCYKVKDGTAIKVRAR